MNILVTGSSGTIGTALCEKFLHNNINFIGVDKKKNCFNEEVNNKTIIHDLRTPFVSTGGNENIDIIIHLAANARVYDLVVNPSMAYDNFMMTYNIMEFARLNNVKKVIFSSSREVYGGGGERSSYSEKDASIDRVMNPYSATKMSSELYIKSYKECYGIDYIITRFSNVFGRYDFSDRLVPLYIYNCINNKELVVFGKDKKLDFTYIDDTVDGVFLCCNNFDKYKNNIFNIAGGKRVFVEDVAVFIKEQMKSSSSIVVMDNRIGEIMDYEADIAKIKDMTGFSPKYEWKEAVMKAIDWYLSQGDFKLIYNEK